MTLVLEREVQVKSAERVRNHGEVLTARREVEAMLDLVKNEAERIDSRFLEPACGTGNFLTAILERKLKTVTERYRTKTVDFEIHILSALGSIYGIDLLEDNIIESQERMFDMAFQCYKKSLKKNPDEIFRNLMKFVLSKNIQQGDSLNGIDKIIFTQWTFIGYQIKLEEYSFAQMNRDAELMQTPLFTALQNEMGENVYIPEPVTSYPAVYYRNLLEVCE